MIRLKSLGSSSKGNCFIIDDGITTILLDAGLPSDQIQKGLFKLGYNQKDIKAVLISHSHQDHIQGVQAINSCKKYMTKPEFDKAKQKFTIDPRDVIFIEKGQQFEVGTLKIKAFGIKHDSPDPVCFIMSNASGEKIMYLTDTGIANLDLENADMYIIEANHSEAILKDHLEKGTISPERYKRVTQNHLSSEKAIKYLRKNVGDKTKHVILMHLSTTNTNPVGTMNFVRAKLDNSNISFIHPIKHNIKREWVVGYIPKQKRSF